MKKFLRALFIIAFSVIILLIAIYINHRIRLKQEAELRSPLGEIVEVDGHNISIYTEGAGGTALVFMSGGGTCSPILDFKYRVNIPALIGNITETVPQFLYHGNLIRIA